MKIIAGAEAFLRLRDGRVWTLLASDDAPFTLAIFQALFMGTERTLLQSILVQRLGDALDDLCARGYQLSQTPQAYIAYWRTKGWLSRHLRHGESEEEYGLTPEAATAVRILTNLLKPRSVATESRLASVMHQVLKLTDDTDTNPTSRLEALYAERARIDQEIADIGQGNIKVLPDDRALERAREIVAQANELIDDFQNVRGSFERLNQELRAHLLEAEGTRGQALEALFNGVDYIQNSESGRTFSAFWRLLTDVEQSSALEEAVEHLTSRRFAKDLSSDERKFILNLTTRLAVEAGSVQEVMHVLGTSLNRFVRNEDPAQNRRLNEVLQRAKLAALALKDGIDARQAVDFSLTNSVPQIRSIAQYQLKDPQLHAPAASITKAVPSSMSLTDFQSLIGQSEIDMRSLKGHIRSTLASQAKVTLVELLQQYPAEQGFGTVVGYITLGTKFGHVTKTPEIVTWTGADGVQRSAELPVIYFTADKVAELHD